MAGKGTFVLSMSQPSRSPDLFAQPCTQPDGLEPGSEPGRKLHGSREGTGRAGQRIEGSGTRGRSREGRKHRHEGPK